MINHQARTASEKCAQFL